MHPFTHENWGGAHFVHFPPLVAVPHVLHPLRVWKISSPIWAALREGVGHLQQEAEQLNALGRAPLTELNFSSIGLIQNN